MQFLNMNFKRTFPRLDTKESQNFFWRLCQKQATSQAKTYDISGIILSTDENIYNGYQAILFLDNPKWETQNQYQLLIYLRRK